MIIFTCLVYILAVFIGAVSLVTLMRIEALLAELLNSSADLCRACEHNSVCTKDVTAAVSNHTEV